MDMAVICQLLSSDPDPSGDSRVGDERRARFEVVRVLKGESLIRAGQRLETIYLGKGQPGDSFLIMGIDPATPLWSTPLLLSDRAVKYLEKIVSLPKDGAGRYPFFLDYLEDADPLLARDAYDELAGASYATLRSLKSHLRREQLLDWVQDRDVSATRRRLYFVMLGICGNEQDLPLLERLMASADRQDRQGLDMIIFCYLALRGEAGLDKVQDAFLKDRECEYADTSACLAALRFHAQEGVDLSPPQVLPSLRLMLDRPDLADLVVPDLVRWQDWSVMDKLMQLFASADEKTSWVRVPVINYLRACPLPKAKEHLAECERIDPQSVRRAHAFFPSAAGGELTPSENSSPGDVALPANSKFVSTSGAAVPASFAAPIPQPDEDPPGRLPERSPAPEAKAASNPVGSAVASVNPGAAPAKALRSTPPPRANLWQLLGVPILAGALLWFLQSSILRGRIGRG